MPLFRKAKVYTKVPKQAPKSSRLGPEIGLTFKSVKCQVKVNNEYREILCGVSGFVKPAQTLALMGPSGAGKTTLLNVISLRCRDGDVAADIRWNGIRTLDGFTQKQIHRFQAFVPQAVCLMHTLTVEENVRFSANLRLPASFSSGQREKHIHRTINQLRLAHVANSIIGHEQGKVLSGGEKKRTSIAVQLVSAPSILFLDEPTTGLSATDSLQVACLLSSMAKSGITIVCSLHQPRTDIFKLFDNLLLLSLGNTAYFGPTRGAESFFERMGYETPPSESLPDFLLDVITEDEVILGETSAIASNGHGSGNNLHAHTRGLAAKFKASQAHRDLHDYLEMTHSHNAGGFQAHSSFSQQQKTDSSDSLDWDANTNPIDSEYHGSYEDGDSHGSYQNSRGGGAGGGGGGVSNYYNDESLDRPGDKWW
jgi:ABC-type multidrug transport system ATPase subunit